MKETIHVNDQREQAILCFGMSIELREQCESFLNGFGRLEFKTLTGLEPCVFRSSFIRYGGPYTAIPTPYVYNVCYYWHSNVLEKGGMVRDCQVVTSESEAPIVRF